MPEKDEGEGPSYFTQLPPLAGYNSNVLIPSEKEMVELGAKLAQKAQPGQVFRLIGPLGVGKTTLVRGFLKGLGYEGDVRSPTFNLLYEYPTTPPVCHIDLYRLDDTREILHLGIEDYRKTHILLVEWAEKAGDILNDEAITITLCFANGNRRVEISNKL